MTGYDKVYRVVEVHGDGSVTPVTRPYTTLGAARNQRSHWQNDANTRSRNYNRPAKLYKVQGMVGGWEVVD